jgi:NAD(P)H-dependent FMN reductase
MITIIIGTNRKNSMSAKVANLYRDIVASQVNMANVPVHVVSLEGLNLHEPNDTLTKIEEEVLMPTQKFIFIIPEYNGSFPGILKYFMDSTRIQTCWWYKEALLVGLADGRAGNLRGTDHFTSILNYLKINVHYNKLTLPHISKEIDQDGQFINQSTNERAINQVVEFLRN